MAEVSFNEAISFSRASTATYWGSSRTLLEAAVDEARIQHDPVTGEALGLLIEPSRTNECRYSQDLGSWSDKLRCVTVGNFPAPDGSNTAWQLAADYSDTTSVGVRISDQYNQFSDGIGKSVSGFFKAGTYDHVRLSRSRAGNANQSLVVNLVTGQVSSRGSVANATAISVGDGWWWVKASFDYSILQHPVIYLSDYIGSSDTGWYEETETSPKDGEFIYVWGYQFESGTPPSSYIPASGSPVTRAADNVAIDLPDDAFNPNEGTLRITAQVPEGEVVASLGDMQVVSDSDEKKTYQITYSDYTGVPTVTLGNGIHSKLEYFPEAQS